MEHRKAGFTSHTAEKELTLALFGDWLRGKLPHPDSEPAIGLDSIALERVFVDGSEIGDWDSALVARLLFWHNRCAEQNTVFLLQNMPSGVEQLLTLATTVKPLEQTTEAPGSWLSSANPVALIASVGKAIGDSLEFIGDVALAIGALIKGKANTRMVDFWNFCYQAGPDAFAIISLTSVLVGMILAYLGAVQLQQFGAEIYVADLVVIGMLREMGVLMTAIVMSGRTGAAYAAQLGTMQTNEEIDAIRTMGISPIEFLVVPRMLALVVVMPLLTIYADILGILGGSIVAASMGISPAQYLIEGETALSYAHISVGLLKSVVFGILIAVAGCRAGINSGRSSAAVGEAATRAVVTAVVYLIVADATINIIFQQLKL